MTRLDVLRKLQQPAETKMFLVVLDGIGGLPKEPGGPTELEAARTPELDRLVSGAVCGLMDPVFRGITPGSGPAHLALFGYDPLEYDLGRGLLEALGVHFPVEPGDLAIRINFCTVDAEGRVTDRRAGRIATEISTQLCEKLQAVRVPGVETFVRPVKEHRAVVVFRGEGLYDAVDDTDPQVTGVPPRDPVATDEQSQRSADVAAEFIRQAREILHDERPANMVMLRGFARHEELPQMGEVYGVKAAAIAAVPMYKGVAQLVGMDVLETGERLSDEIEVLRRHYERYDYFFFHFKYTDKYGEDGAFEKKVAAIEEADAAVAQIAALNPDVLVVTGDHSTPAVLKSHSWHPVPIVLAAKTCRADAVSQFTERACLAGGLGRFPSVELMGLMMAHALRLKKYGA